jgi:Sulfotransferase family
MLQVDSVSPAPTDERLIGAGIDRPAPALTELHVLEIVGWALGRWNRVSDIKVLHAGKEIARAIIDVPRPDLGDLFPHVTGAACAGFQASVANVDLPSIWQLEVVAIVGGEAAPIGRITGHRGPLRSSHRPRLQPLFLTTVGRTGSIWVTHLLAQHPKLVAYRPFHFEPRVATYWATILKTLARPDSYLRPIAPGVFRSNSTWWLGFEPPNIVMVPEPELQHFYGHEQIEAVATFCHRRIDAFYARVAKTQGKRRARFFIEKLLPDTPEYRVLLELYPDKREVVLVRDPRDVFCSVLAFGSRRGFFSQGRELVDGGEDYVPILAGFVEAARTAWKQGAYLLRYEDLVHEPLSTLTSLLEFVGVDASRPTVRAMLEAASEELPQMATHRTTPTTEASVGRWRRELDPSIRGLLERELGPAMLELGYEIGDQPA